MSEKKNSALIAASLLAVVILWGGNNAGTKWLLGSWPPVFTGSLRFVFGGMILLAILRFTNWLGTFEKLSPELKKQLWLRGGLSLAAYTIVFNWALRLTSASHVALYIGASPVWALLAEERPRRNWASLRRYSAALLAVVGVLVLFWPTLKTGRQTHVLGELCGLTASFIWALYSRQSRWLSARVNGLEVTANNMWMAGLILIPLGLVEIYFHGLTVTAPRAGVMALSIVFGGVIPYAFWTNALRHWRASRVLLFNNLIPVTTSVWVYFTLDEPITPTFCAAMALIILGVLLEQVDLAKIFRLPESF
ncbi:MAG TPA: DMT family transporter [Verrucomicrobiae bacterium]|nr:DMT family transporter [Verrucomicrobiae bacterium]